MRRPFVVLLIGLVMCLTGALQVAVGLVFLLERGDVRFELDAGLSRSTLTSLGVWLLVLGALSVFLAWGLLRGSRLARATVGLVEVAQIVAGTYTLVSVGSGHRTSGLWSIAGGLLVLYLLYGTEKARRYFGR